jgi:radical SAM superfamily enzyme YgiQ (UPF0313 family)
MARRIVLVSLNRYTSPDPVFPLGLSHLHAALRQAGYETRWVDCQAEAQPLAEAIHAGDPDYICISLRNIDDILIGTRETFFPELVALCHDLRHRTRAPIILGGSGFSIYPGALLKNTGADYGVCGEGEVSLLALLNALENGNGYGTIPGLVWRDEATIRVNPLKPSVLTDALEAVDWPSNLVQHYLESSGMLNVQSQRGCAWNCCYCTYPIIEGRQHRRRPPEAVAAEFERLAHMGARYLFMVDSVFNSSPAHVFETCEAIRRLKIRVRWGCFLRPCGLGPDLMEAMAAAGLCHIEFGSDSFCDEVLACYGKSFRFADVQEASELARRYRIDYCHFLICGGPGETLDTLERTYAASKFLAGAVVMAVIGMRIYPGTPLAERALAEGVISAQADLLQPAYYLAPGLYRECILEKVRSFAQMSPNWIAGEPSAAYLALAGRLRARGVAGPLWSYWSTIQRLWPTPTGEAGAVNELSGRGSADPGARRE